MALPFRQGSVSWKVNMEPTIALGGGRALLLQVSHPLVAAGVEQHSDFRSDPFARGFSTIDVMLKLAFGDEETSVRQAEMLRRIHSKVEGTSSDGVGYRALDADLLLWVWATLVDVSMLMYERAVRPFGPGERERYYEEQKSIAYASGVPEGRCPATHHDFDAYVARTIDDALEVTSVARIVAYAGRHPPMPRPIAAVVGPLITLFTAGLLPPHLRADLGYRWSPAREHLLDALFALLRTLARMTPRTLRFLPNRYLVKRKTPLGFLKGRAVKLPADLQP